MDAARGVPVESESRAVLRARIAGLVIGAAVPAFVLIVALAGDPSALGHTQLELPGFGEGVVGFVAFVALYGIPVGALLGWLAGPAAARGSSLGSAIGLALGVAFAAIVLGSAEVGIVWSVGESLAGGASDPAAAFLFGLVMFPLFGILIFGLPALVAIFPITLAWTAAMRVISEARTGSPAAT